MGGKSCGGTEQLPVSKGCPWVHHGQPGALRVANERRLKGMQVQVAPQLFVAGSCAPVARDGRHAGNLWAREEGEDIGEHLLWQCLHANATASSVRARPTTQRWQRRLRRSRSCACTCASASTDTCTMAVRQRVTSYRYGHTAVCHG